MIELKPINQKYPETLRTIVQRSFEALPISPFAVLLGSTKGSYVGFLTSDGIVTSRLRRTTKDGVRAGFVKPQTPRRHHYHLEGRKTTPRDDHQLTDSRKTHDFTEPTAFRFSPIDLEKDWLREIQALVRHAILGDHRRD